MEDDFSLFENPRHYIASAQECLERIDALTDDYQRNCTYEPVRKRNNKTDEVEIWMRASIRPSPKIRIHTTHLFEHIRHALDQAICDSVLMRRSDASLSDIEFPFGNSSDSYNSKKKKFGARVSPAVLRYIDSLEPYLKGDERFWVISKLAALKHRRAILVTPVNRGAALGPVNGRIEIHANEIQFGRHLNSNNELKFMTLSPDAPFTANVKFDSVFTFGEVPVVQGVGVQKFARDSIARCAEVIDAIEKISRGQA